MHETETTDGVTRMRPLERLVVAPGQTVTLAPGGKHLMLHGFDPAVDQTTLKATLSDGSSLPVTFEVRSWPRPQAGSVPRDANVVRARSEPARAANGAPPPAQGHTDIAWNKRHGRKLPLAFAPGEAQ